MRLNEFERKAIKETFEQKIDIVIHQIGEEYKPIEKTARENGGFDMSAEDSKMVEALNGIFKFTPMLIDTVLNVRKYATNKLDIHIIG